nr:salivary sheath protein [Laodelphax striatellus]
MKGLVLCAVFLVLGGNQSFGVNVNLDFLKDPDFPGNAGWNAKLNQQIADTVNNPDFPGNAGWNAKLDQQIKDTMNSAMNSANTGSSGSNVVSNSMQNMENINVGNDYVTSTAPTLNRPTPVPAVPMKPSFNIQGPNLQNMRLPHAPPNFPFPPDCSEVADPGYKFRDPLQINYGDQKPEIRHRSFLCTDPEYGQDSFYMQMTEARNPNGSGSSRIAAYYDKTGNSIDYSRKMIFLPLGEKLPDMPRNDYLKMDVTF